MLVTSNLWNYVMDHMRLFFDVVLNPNSFKDLDRLRQLLTPYQISHINLKENMQRFLLDSKNGNSSKTKQPD